MEKVGEEATTIVPNRINILADLHRFNVLRFNRRTCFLLINPYHKSKGIY